MSYEQLRILTSIELFEAYAQQSVNLWSLRKKYAEFEPYFPIPFMAPSCFTNPDSIADPLDPDRIQNWHCVEGFIDRTSAFMYDIKCGLPKLVNGQKYGICGRGYLKRWGPNNVSMTIFTRWKLDKDGQKIFGKSTKKPILQFVVVKRTNTEKEEYALPEGEYFPGENIYKLVKQEFENAATVSAQMNDGVINNNDVEVKLKTIYENGVEICREIVINDPRNTDNAWIEARVFNFHDCETFRKINFEDSNSIFSWIDCDINIMMYANHKRYIQKVAKKLGAHFE